MSSRIAPVTPLGLPPFDSVAFDPDQMASLLFMLSGMSFREARSRALELTSRIAQDRKSVYRVERSQFTYVDQQVAIAQFMKCPILLAQSVPFRRSCKFAQHRRALISWK